MHAFAMALRRYIYKSNILYNLRIFITLTGVALVPWWIGRADLTIPLTLGVAAAGLSDLDDRLVGRLHNLVVILFCFIIASVSVVLLYPYPILFACGLALSTWGFILLGALGQRYATIAFGALLIATYTMLGITMYDVWYQQPLLLLTGAIWYNVLALMGHFVLPVRPLQESISRSYRQLANYLEAKANLFDPDLELNFDLPLRDVAMANSTLVSTLNETKNTLLTRLKGDRGQRNTRRTLHYYFVAQDIHERASSAHVQYKLLSKHFRHSDILFRFHRLLGMQAKACRKLANSILLRQKYQHSSRFELAFSRIDETLQHLLAEGANKEQVKALTLLLNNLKAIDVQLANVESEQALAELPATENKLSDEGLTGIKDIYLRIRREMTPQSPIFRHAVRMSIVLVIGYLIIQMTPLKNGFWILLTSLFVCQPNYNATRRRLALRVIGTIAGILVGMPFLYFVPSLEGQLVLLVISGVLFFAFRTARYAQATMFITLMILMCFNILGEGFEIALPRIYDTLIGCSIAWAGVTFIWPDWKFRQFPNVINKTLRANSNYLNAILLQYHEGKDNSMAYRVARRDAHNADAELASVVSNMALDTRMSKELQDAGFRLLCLNHTLLGYISALGAHRDKLFDQTVFPLFDLTVEHANAILNNSSKEGDLALLPSHDELNQFGNDTKEHFALQQMGLIIEMLPEIKMLKEQITSGS